MFVRWILIAIFFPTLCFAEPPLDVIQACMSGESDHSLINQMPLEERGFAKTREAHCEAQYKLRFENQEFASVMCDDEAFFLIAGQKISARRAVNHSLNPEIKPGSLHPALSSWSKIEVDGCIYLCIESPLSASGQGAAHNQYYLIEEPFSRSKIPVVHYYFFNQSIKPVVDVNRP